MAEAEAFLQWLAGPDGQQILVQEAGLNSPYKSCTVVANDPFAPTVADFTARGKTSGWHFLEQPANMAEDFTGAIFQDYAKGDINTQEFIDDMVATIPQAVK